MWKPLRWKNRLHITQFRRIWVNGAHFAVVSLFPVPWHVLLQILLFHKNSSQENLTKSSQNRLRRGRDVVTVAWFSYWWLTYQWIWVMLASILDNSLSFWCADLVVWFFFFMWSRFCSKFGRRCVQLTGLYSGSLFYSHSQRYINIILLIYLRFIQQCWQKCILWTAKDIEGTRHVLIWGTFPMFAMEPKKKKLQASSV